MIIIDYLRKTIGSTLLAASFLGSMSYAQVAPLSLSTSPSSLLRPPSSIPDGNLNSEILNIQRDASWKTK